MTKLLSLRLSALDDQRMRILADSAAGEAQADAVLPFHGDARARVTVTKILETTRFGADDFQQPGELDWMAGRGWLDERREHISPDTLEHIGRAMHASLLPAGSAIAELFARMRSAAEQANAPLHVQLQISGEIDDAVAMHQYPWELAHDGRGFPRAAPGRLLTVHRLTQRTAFVPADREALGASGTVFRGGTARRSAATARR